MATPSTTVKVEGSAQPAAPAESPAPLDQNRADQLYNKCAEAPEGTIFYQRDLSSMHVAETTSQLTQLLQELVDRHLMKLMISDNEPCWKLRSRDEADKLRQLSPEERILYHHIDQEQNKGIWSKALRAKTNLTAQALSKCLKSLEAKNLVQSVMSVKFPNRKMYLLKHLQPSEEVAGGPWQSEGDFDAALIDTISRVVESYMQKETCLNLPMDWNQYPTSDRTSAIARKKRIQNYPTALSVRNAIMSMGIIKDKNIAEQDMEQLLEMMVLDGKLEKVSGTNYRTCITSREVESYNGFVDAPCGNCPVFELCGDEGEISARTCVYFGEWLQTESEPVY
ncbi:RNA polymerase Rpc34 [Lojkania enalia]|uniref:DNA-directed RNA polymerase III subunit RPC6 n=1 Tax=Lojkania enalia TaxID=147567 RepID=A0A9P4N244_9PLEO|nr:RNA polymerase Rpc34 [Didymosphaeria enalia]